MYLENPPQNRITEELYLKNYNKRRKEMKRKQMWHKLKTYSTSFPIWQDSKGLMPVKHCLAPTSQSCSCALGSDLRSFFSLHCSFFFNLRLSAILFLYQYPWLLSSLCTICTASYGKKSQLPAVRRTGGWILVSATEETELRAQSVLAFSEAEFLNCRWLPARRE